MSSVPYLGGGLVAGSSLLQSVEFIRGDMKSENGVIDEEPHSGEKWQKVGPASTRTKCSHCKRIITTRTQAEASMQTHVIAAMLFPFCCCIPYYFPCCKNVHHFCPSCEQYLETFRR